MTDFDKWTRELRKRQLTLIETRAAICQVVSTCPEAGVRRLRDVVLDDEPVFYVDEPTRKAS